jgi:GntR family transcriptional regulator
MNPRPEPELCLSGGADLAEQIRTQIRDYINTGQLRPGEQLPTVRAMAVELGVNPSVVEGAYQELEQEGFVSSEEGSGLFVAAQPPAGIRQAAYRKELDRLCRELLAQAARYGYSAPEVIEALRALSGGSAEIEQQDAE